MTRINATPQGNVPFTAEQNAAWENERNSEEYLAKEQESLGKRVRAERDTKLSACDWTVLTDSPLTTAKKTEWKTYRQALRDITSAEGFPQTVTWPSEPS